jgi:hypothetical protein
MGANAQDTLAVARILLDRDVPINHASYDQTLAYQAMFVVSLTKTTK